MFAKLVSSAYKIGQPGGKDHKIIQTLVGFLKIHA
jgi:hypothetical protein